MEKYGAPVITALIAALITGTVVAWIVQRPARLEERLRALELKVGQVASGVKELKGRVEPRPRQQLINTEMRQRMSDMERSLDRRLTVQEQRQTQVIQRLHRFLDGRSAMPERYNIPRERENFDMP